MNEDWHKTALTLVFSLVVVSMIMVWAVKELRGCP